MIRKEFSVEIFNEFLIESLNEISGHMRNHRGILHIIRSRFKFEKWFQIELLSRLLEKTSAYSDISLHNEISITSKISKKGKTIDLAIKINKEKFIGIELKIIPTSYQMDGFENKTKAMPEGISGLITDLKKCRDDSYPFQISVGLVFPLPIDLNHRNYKDFERQVLRLREYGKLEFIDCKLSDNFISRYYLLSNENSK